MDIIIIVIILVICCCCCILGGGGYYYINYVAPKSASNNTSTPSSSDNTSTPTTSSNTPPPPPTTLSPTTPAPLQIPVPIVTGFNAPTGEYSSCCNKDCCNNSDVCNNNAINKQCNCRMDFKVLYQVTVNGVKWTSPPSAIIGTSDNCFIYWNPTLYFNITNPPISISSDIKLILLTSRSGENNWYYSKVEPFTIEVSADKTKYTSGIKFSGATATFDSKYT